MEKIKNLSIRKAIIFYMSVSLILSFLLGAVITKTAQKTQEQIWWKYIDEEEYLKIEHENSKKENISYDIRIPRIGHDSMTEMDVHMSEACDFLQTYSILVTSVMGIICAVFLFYRNKIKIPLEELTAASRMIADNELDFHITYSNKDELGMLCTEFEKMRGELENNSRKLWRMVEEEKVLRSAVAHDIRTPLSILKGYQEMLLEFIPDETVSKEKIMEMLQEGMDQVNRINDLVENMRKLSALEDLEIKTRDTDIDEICSLIGRSVDALKKDTGKNAVLHKEGRRGCLHADINVVLEVTENLVSNALRYAKQEVNISVSVVNGNLEILIRDDGTGFRSDIRQVTKARYHSNPRDEGSHFGMGMYISKLYCEKHGGRLLVGNHSLGGASVKAVFKVTGI